MIERTDNGANESDVNFQEDALCEQDVPATGELRDAEILKWPQKGETAKTEATTTSLLERCRHLPKLGIGCPRFEIRFSAEAGKIGSCNAPGS